jgi:hypothetical protein
MKDANWQREFRHAQTVKTYRINSQVFKRVAYGEEKEDWGAELHQCRDCGVSEGCLHLLGCDMEQCGACSPE